MTKVQQLITQANQAEANELAGMEEALEAGLAEANALGNAAENRSMSADYWAEKLLKSSSSILTQLEIRRDQQLDKLHAERKLANEGFARDIKETKELVEDLQDQLRTHAERLQGLEEARHETDMAALNKITIEQDKFKTLIDAQRSLVNGIS